MAIDPTLLEALLAGGATGAVSGGIIGAPTGVGAPIGAIIGGIAGLGAGRLQYKSDEKALAAAEDRDAELKAELDSVDNLEMFVTAQTAAAAGQRQEAQLGGQQAAARGGLSAAAGYELGQGAVRDVDRNQSRLLAQTVPGAAAADTAERSQILQTEITRQQLANDALQGDDILGAFGNLAGMATTASMIKNAPESNPGLGSRSKDAGGDWEEAYLAERLPSEGSEHWLYSKEEGKALLEKNTDDVKSLQKSSPVAEVSKEQKKAAEYIGGRLASGEVTSEMVEAVAREGGAEAFDSAESFENTLVNIQDYATSYNTTIGESPPANEITRGDLSGVADPTILDQYFEDTPLSLGHYQDLRTSEGSIPADMTAGMDAAASSLPPTSRSTLSEFPDARRLPLEANRQFNQGSDFPGARKGTDLLEANRQFNQGSDFPGARKGTDLLEANRQFNQGSDFPGARRLPLEANRPFNQGSDFSGARKGTDLERENREYRPRPTEEEATKALEQAKVKANKARRDAAFKAAQSTSKNMSPSSRTTIANQLVYGDNY